MATRMLQRRGTAAEWAAQNPVLSDGEIGFETDTKIIRVGDGETAWNDLSLPYLPSAGGVTTGPISLVAPTENVHAARKQDVDAVTTLANTKLPIAGGTMTGPLSVVAPTANNHAARKQDIDEIAAAKPLLVRKRTTSFNVSNNIHTQMSFNSQITNIGGWSTSESVFTIPESGWYEITVLGAFAGVNSTSGWVQMSVTLNSTTVTAGSLLLVAGSAKTSAQNNGGASGQISGITVPYDLDEGDELRCFAFQRTGDTLAMVLRNDTPQISIQRIR